MFTFWQECTSIGDVGRVNCYYRVEGGEERVEPRPRGDGGVHPLGGDEAEVERRRGGLDHGDGILDGHEEEESAPEERRQRVAPQHPGHARRRAPLGPPPPTRRRGRAHLPLPPLLRAGAVCRVGLRERVDLGGGVLLAPARGSSVGRGGRRHRRGVEGNPGPGLVRIARKFACFFLYSESRTPGWVGGDLEGEGKPVSRGCSATKARTEWLPLLVVVVVTHVSFYDPTTDHLPSNFGYTWV
jgi:hypothetical protein